MRKYLLMTTVAGVALFAGAAQAADIQPIVPVVVAPPIAVPGPVYAIEVRADVVASTFGGIESLLSTAIDVRTVSGWGFKLELSGFLELSPPPFESDLTVLGRLYHTVGANGTVGIFGSVTRSSAADESVLIGLDADLVTDTTELTYILVADFGPTGYDGLQSILALELARREHLRVDVVAFAVLPAGGGLVALTVAEIGYQIGPVTPYVQLAAVYTGPFIGSVALGVDLELPVGSGPLTLTGGVLAGFGPGGFGWEANLGFELKPNDGPLNVNGELTAFSGGGWEARLGIGVEFGAGRVSGFGVRTLEDLPI